MEETEGDGSRTRDQALTFSAKLYFDSYTLSLSIYGEWYVPWHTPCSVLCSSPR